MPTPVANMKSSATMIGSSSQVHVGYTPLPKAKMKTAMSVMPRFSSAVTLIASGMTIGSNCILRSRFSRETSAVTQLPVVSAKNVKRTSAKRM